MNRSNPYFELRRREFPEPLIALLAFFLGLWLWDNHFAPKNNYPPGTEQMTLLRLDRDLKLAAAMSSDPQWLRWLAQARTLPEVFADAERSLKSIFLSEEISPSGYHALAIFRSLQTGKPVASYLGPNPRSDPLRDTDVAWYQMLASPDRKLYPDAAAGKLRLRAIGVGLATWLPIALGVACIPYTLKRFVAPPRSAPSRYLSTLSLSAGLTVFMAAMLTWIGLFLASERVLQSSLQLPTWASLSLEVLVFTVPALVAIGLLFRRLSHAARSFGLRAPLEARLILGSFALICLLNYPLRLLLSPSYPSHPAGGLAVEQAGLAGLVISLLSACVMAPMVEELLYRGVLFRALSNQLGAVLAALISSLVFGLFHFYDSYGIMNVAIVGLYCAWIYRTTGSLSHAILLHVLYNASIVVPRWTIYHTPL